MKWIKASERFPVFSHRTISRFVHTQTPLFDLRDFLLKNPEKADIVEWLDESASLPSTTVEGDVRKGKEPECKDGCNHFALIDTGVGYHHCPVCKLYWTYEEFRTGKAGWIQPKCQHKNIVSSDGCDKCEDCGATNY